MTRLDPVDPPELGRPRGYSNGMLAKGPCDLLFVAGQIGWNARHELVSEHFAAQFEQALRNVLHVVAAAGGDASHVARLTIYVTDKREYLAQTGDIGASYRALMGRHYPAMSLVQVKDLLEDGAKVEIEATAAIPRRAAP